MVATYNFASVYTQLVYYNYIKILTFFSLILIVIIFLLLQELDPRMGIS